MFFFRRFHQSSVRKSVGEKDTIVQLLSNIGSRKEVDQYLRQFNTVSLQKFAVIKVGGAVLTDELDVLASSLSFLYRVGLFPIVIHGAGPQLNQVLESNGVVPKYVNGVRYTDNTTLAYARNCFQSENYKLVEKLESLGTKARPVIGGLFNAEFLDKEKYGLVGKITGVNKNVIESSIRAGALPIVTSLAETVDGQILNVNADTAAGELARVLEPLKIIFLSGSGGMAHPVTKKKIPVINLDDEYEGLHKEFSKLEKKGQLLKLMEIKQLLDHLPRTSSVAITSAQYLSKELFTDSGAGTLIRRGHKLFHMDSINELDVDRFRLLLEENDQDVMNESTTVAKYLGTLADFSSEAPIENKLSVYGDEAYEVCAVVKRWKGTNGEIVNVLDKFVATKVSILNNVTDNLWTLIKSQNPNLIWSIEKDNVEARQWYFDKADGSINHGNRTYFWYGENDFQEIMKFIDSSCDTKSPKYFNTGGPRKRSFSNLSIPSRSYSTSSSRRKRVGLIGARGYTGNELITLLDAHPNIEISHVSSRELAGKTIPLENQPSLTYSNLSADMAASCSDVDAWIMALPNKVCEPWVRSITSSSSGSNSPVIVDLSADYRFDSNWTYGLPELYPGRRSLLRQSKRISNPGCYATGAQIGLFPLVGTGLIDPLVPPVVVGISGYSGAGTKATIRNSPDTLRDNIVPYSLTGHIHENEVSVHLKHAYQLVQADPKYKKFFNGIGMNENSTFNSVPNGIHFVPHVSSFFRGIQLTLDVTLRKSVTGDNLRDLYSDWYKDERLIRVLEKTGGIAKDGVPYVASNAGQHWAAVGGFGVGQGIEKSIGKRAVICVTLDNLLKGAATQALQNLNLALGFGEYDGIPK